MYCRQLNLFLGSIRLYENGGSEIWNVKKKKLIYTERC